MREGGSFFRGRCVEGKLDGTSPPPSGHLPFQGRLLVRGCNADFGAGNFGLHTPVLSDKAFRRLYTVSRRNAMERNRRRLGLCPPGKAPIRVMAGGNHGVRGPALVTWKFWLAPGRFCPLCPSAKWVVRPQTDEILSSQNPSAVVCRQSHATIKSSKNSKEPTAAFPPCGRFLFLTLYLLSYPSVRKSSMRLRQSGRTFTHNFRFTCMPSSFSMSARASEPITCSIAPCRPIMMPLCASRSQ